VTVQNAVVYNSAKAFRYEDNIQNLKLWNITLGRNVTSAFQAASSSSSGMEVRNMLLLGTALPSEAAHPSNRLATATSFVNAANDNYALVAGSTAIDAGIALPNVRTDRAGTARPQGAAHDVGAFEWVPSVTGGDGDVVVHVGKQPSIVGDWRIVADATAASGVRVWQADQGIRFKNVQPYPTHYFEVTAWVEAGQTYHLWVRARADANSPNNDGLSVQFATSVDAAGNPIYRIGTTSAARISLQECSTCVLSGWGWQDQGTGQNVLGPAVRFTTTGLQRIQVQLWEDGLSVDQIVLSPSTYLSVPPGPGSNDTTILPES
jgi:hypothetical protein